MSQTDPQVRWIVAQEGSRRNYAVPVAFQREGSLRLLYTDIWCRQGRAQLLKSRLRAVRALAGRFHPEIPSDRVVSFGPSAMARRVTHQLRVGAITQEEVGHFWCDFGEWFGSRVAAHLENLELDPKRDLFFGFNTNCLEVIPLLQEQKVLSVISQVDPGLVEENLVQEENERWPSWESSQGRMPQRYWNRLKAEWSRADMVVVNSEWSKTALVKQGVSAEKISVVPLAIDLKKMAGVRKKKSSSGALRVLWLGSVILRKGIPYLVEAARSLPEKDFQFLIAGEVRIARDIVKTFPRNLTMLGQLPRSEALALYDAADVFVLPTLSDGFAVTQLEAMAHGLPVITTPHCGEVVTEGRDGFLIPRRNSAALADALARLHRDRDLLREMSHEAQKKVRQFDIPVNARTLDEAVRIHRQCADSTAQPKVGRNASASRTPEFALAQPDEALLPKLSLRKDTGERLPKAVVCFAGSRDYYQLARALEEVGLLEKLMTDLYLDLPHLPMGNAIGRQYPKLLARSSPGLPNHQIITPPSATLFSLLMRTGIGNAGRQTRLDRIIGRKARELAWQTQSALFSYSYYAATAFAPGSQRPKHRFLFQLHPHPAVVREILKEEMWRAPKFAASLKWEHEIGSPEEHFQSLCSEPKLANGWVVASSFTAATLTAQGIPPNEIHVVPYGVDTKDYPCRDAAPPDKDPFRVIWIGSMTQRKGLSYFLEAIGSLPQENLEVLICGYHAVDQAVIEGYGIRSVNIFKSLPTAELTKLLRTCDLFVLPSLAEGFGHVILESMSSGVPVLTTTSTCAPDVLVDGTHGFIIPTRDPAAIANRIAWGRAHRSELYQMGQAAAARARTFTWERFREGIVTAYTAMIQNRLSRAGQKDLDQDTVGAID